MGAAVACPGGSCDPVWNGNKWLFFSAFTDGSYGWYGLGEAPQQNDTIPAYLELKSDCGNRVARERYYQVDAYTGRKLSSYYVSEHFVEGGYANYAGGGYTSPPALSTPGAFDDFLMGLSLDKHQWFTAGLNPSGYGKAFFLPVRTNRGTFNQFHIELSWSFSPKIDGLQATLKGSADATCDGEHTP